MRRWIWIGVLGAALSGAGLDGASQRALADEDPLVCRREAVLARVSALLLQAGRKVALDARTVGEQSAGTGRVVSCAVQGHILGYETKPNAIQPIDTVFVVRYSLELRENGIFLRLD